MEVIESLWPLQEHTLALGQTQILLSLSEVGASSRSNCSSLSCEVPPFIARSVKGSGLGEKVCKFRMTPKCH